MAQRGKGGIIFLSSLVGFYGTPRFAHYAATKAYNLILAEGLASELKSYGVSVLALAPGFTDSEYVSRLDLSRLPMKPMPASRVVAKALRKLGHGSLAIPGAMNLTMNAMNKLLFPRALASRMNGVIMGRVSLRKGVI